MRDGTYHYAIRLHAPIGLRYGMLELCIQDRTVSGALTMFSQTHPITDVCLQDGKLCFGGQMQTLLCFLPYRAQGTVDAGRVELELRTEKGCFRAEGSVDLDKEKPV